MADVLPIEPSSAVTNLFYVIILTLPAERALYGSIGEFASSVGCHRFAADTIIMYVSPSLIITTSLREVTGGSFFTILEPVCN